MNRRYPVAIIAIIIAGFLSTSLSAGILTAPLQDRLSNFTADSDDFVRVVIIPVSNHDSKAMKSSLSRSFKTRADRHRVGVAQLKAVADQSQVSAKAELARLESNGAARRVKTFWITNLIEAELTAAGIEQLAADPTIEKIDLYPTIVSITAQLSPSQPDGVGGIETNLSVVKADSAWQLGFDGSGRLVCNFDTGVDGAHPALTSNYRGNKGYDPAQCWFSPTDSSTYPHHFPTAGLSAFHGSHTMGIMVGHDDATGDTVGVAPGADWIAAVAIDVPGSSIFQAFQWAADPDGNPNTVTDLPDVINHSWGLPQIECFDIFWDVIDNTEALGIVNIFSAGNNGPSSSTILSPASRAEDSLTNFAVGNYNQDDDVIVSSSARGPSPCDSYSIKPNVVAPGWYIRSTSYNSNYKNANGTSMAAPHVAGAVAILRQKNPEATVDEIKTALLNSAQDRGTFGKDNNFGWGLLDIVEALKQIDLLTRPSLQIEELAYSEIQPGDFLQLELVLKNSGASTDGVFAEFSHPESGMTLHTTSIDFGKIQSEDTSPGQSTLDLEFDLSLETGRFYSLDMNIFDEDGHLKYQRLSFFVGSPGQRSYFHHDAGRTKFTISNYGAFGFHGTSGNNASSGSYIPLDFLGFQFDTTVNDMFEGALLIGTDDEHVSDCARNFALEPDNDFAPVPGGSIVSFEPGSEADQETVSHFDDSFAEHPIGLNIEQHTYGWADMPDDKFIILEYIISNNSGGSIGGIRAGLFFDWDITSAGSNYGSFLPNDEIGFLFYFNSVDSSDFRGVKILNSEGMINHRIFIWDDILDGNLTEEKKYAALSNNFINANPPAITDLSHVTTTGPFNIGPGQSDTAVFAIIAGADWTEFMEAATLAEQKWDIVTDIDDTRPPLPTEFALAQNYPNPFNPATTLSFSLPRTGEAVLEIFNILGRRVKVLHDGRLAAGKHNFVWDGTDRENKTVAGGIYFYRLRYDDTSLTKKMLLLK